VKYRVLIEQDEDGMFVAEVPALPGCVSQGETRKEAVQNIQEAITLSFELWAWAKYRIEPLALCSSIPDLQNNSSNLFCQLSQQRPQAFQRNSRIFGQAYLKDDEKIKKHSPFATSYSKTLEAPITWILEPWNINQSNKWTNETNPTDKE
jgi:predicted RNase H-like HicB family nuclease